jgi:type II secretory pathway pseudopilin PulG
MLIPLARLRPTCVVRQPRSGLTLIEIMIALVMTLIILLAMMQAFRYANEEIAKGRAMIELSNQLRTSQETLRSDLAGVTANMQPMARFGSPSGYFEYIEGPTRDNSALLAGRTADAIFGDVDDILCLTTRSDGQAFRGRLFNSGNGTTAIIESSLAEVIWWTDYQENPPGNNRLDYDENLFIRRRALLIRPDLDLSGIPATSFTEIQQFFLNNDISARWVDTDGDGSRDRLIANSLEDLDKRENRFAHFPFNTNTAVYPFALDRATLAAFKLSITGPANLTGQQANFAGNDVANTDACAFDVRIFSPNVPVNQVNQIPLLPSDPGYSTGALLTVGGFVDLNYANIPYASNFPAFSTAPAASPQNTSLNFSFPSTNWLSSTAGQDFVVDTFTRYYEMDGRDEDGALGVDQANNGLDDNSLNGVDDNTERETLPPYPYQISGIEVTFGVHERTTKQTRRTSIVTKFEPGN